MPPDSLFSRFTWKKIKFIALNRDDGKVHILDVSGGNYGIWESIPLFKSSALDRERVEHYYHGQARLIVVSRGTY